MPILTRLACFQGERGEEPNMELARELAETEDTAGIAEVAAGLAHKDKAIQSDCIKVLYEAGAIKPALIAPYATQFIALLESKNNRMVWGAMTALATLACTAPEAISANVGAILAAMAKGSVITVDNGVKALALAASRDGAFNKDVFPFLSDHLKTCRSKEIPQHAESTFPAVNASNRAEFLQTLQSREPELTPPQLARVRKLYRQAEMI